MRIQNNFNGSQQQSSFKENVFLPRKVYHKSVETVLKAAGIVGKDEDGVMQFLELSGGNLFLDVKTAIGKKLADAKKFVESLPLSTSAERKFANQKVDELLVEAEEVAQLPETVIIEA